MSFILRFLRSVAGNILLAIMPAKEGVGLAVWFHEIVTPLSTGNTCPVTIRDSSEAR